MGAARSRPQMVAEATLVISGRKPGGGRSPIVLKKLGKEWRCGCRTEAVLAGPGEGG